MKNEDIYLTKSRNPIKPEVNEISSMDGKIGTNLENAAASFSLAYFLSSLELILTNVT